MRDALMDTSFHYARPGGDPNAEPSAWLGDWAVWGETAATRFAGADADLALDGEVATALVGFDSRWERWLAGVAVSYSEGAGAYRHPEHPGDAVTSRSTSLHPYARFDLNERTDLWANARALVAHRDAAYEEWRFGGTVSYRPGQHGKGLSLKVGSQWGATQSGVQSLWSQAAHSGTALHGSALDAAQRFTAELGYGFEGAGRGALWAPFMAAEAGENGQSIRLGLKLSSGPNVEAGLELGQRRQLSREPENAVQLNGSVRF